jgi:hypothetical protein
VLRRLLARASLVLLGVSAVGYAVLWWFYPKEGDVDAAAWHDVVLSVAASGIGLALALNFVVAVVSAFSRS